MTTSPDMISDGLSTAVRTRNSLFYVGKEIQIQDMQYNSLFVIEAKRQKMANTWTYDTLVSADSLSQILEACPPPRPVFFIFMQFSEKKLFT